MRLWSLHPTYLDPQGLVSLWREALLAQAVLLDKTRGYRDHPQLTRFRARPDPVKAIGTYLSYVHREALDRGYDFDGGKIAAPNSRSWLVVTSGQLEYEFAHLRKKLQVRAPQWLDRMGGSPRAHPMFRVRPGQIAGWERV